jgi:glycosyltransferase involved in cell wall biosynthesis
VAFVEAAKRVSESGVKAQFSIVGPDEGELPAVLNAVAQGPAGLVTYEGSLDYSQTATRMLEASVYVLPSENEPFPMSLLEALSLGIPSVCTSSCGLAEELGRRNAALVTDGSVEELAAAIETLVTDAEAWRAVSNNALEAVREVYGMASVADRLEQAYNGAIAAQRATTK